MPRGASSAMRSARRRMSARSSAPVPTSTGTRSSPSRSIAGGSSSPTSTALSACSAASARRSISSANRISSGSTSSGRRVGPTTQNRTSPAAVAAKSSGSTSPTSSSQSCSVSSDHSLPETGAPKSASAEIRCRVGERGVHRDPAAERAADERGLLDAQRVEQPDHVVVVGERRGRQFRLAVAAQVQRDHPMSLRERRDLPAPHPPVGDAGVQQHHGGAGAALVVREPRAVDLDLGHGEERYGPDMGSATAIGDPANSG